MLDDSVNFSAGSGPRNTTANGSTDDQAAQMEALKTEIAALKETVTSLASTARGLASTSFNAMAADAEEVLKRKVFVSVGVAAFVGYLWGRSR
jgi:ElaB/YqjD/DUF883 family membrane-anchored ribosome-binding protein